MTLDFLMKLEIIHILQVQYLSKKSPQWITSKWILLKFHFSVISIGAMEMS